MYRYCVCMCVAHWKLWCLAYICIFSVYACKCQYVCSIASCVYVAVFSTECVSCLTLHAVKVVLAFALCLSNTQRMLPQALGRLCFRLRFPLRCLHQVGCVQPFPFLLSPFLHTDHPHFHVCKGGFWFSTKSWSLRAQFDLITKVERCGPSFTKCMHSHTLFFTVSHLSTHWYTLIFALLDGSVLTVLLACAACVRHCGDVLYMQYDFSGYCMNQ